MTKIDFTTAIAPLSDRDPCGPDLDLQGDDDYLNFVAVAEGLLPTEYFRDGEAFDASQPAMLAHFDQIGALMRRTRDIRLFCLVARFAILRRDYEQFVGAVHAIAELLTANWEEAHPGAENGSFALRAAALGPLNESTVIFPLQYMPLCEDRRFGVIHYRAQMCAVGEAKPREGEPILSSLSISQAFRDCERERLVTKRVLIDRLAEALETIHSCFGRMCGFDKTPRLDKIRATVAGMRALLTEAAGDEPKGDAAANGKPEPRHYADSRIDAPAHARRALDATMDYFRRHEPSSPVLPLVAKARDIQGKSLAEVLESLVPRHASDAEYEIGDQKFFALPLDLLTQVTPPAEGYCEDSGAEIETEPHAPTHEDAEEQSDPHYDEWNEAPTDEPYVDHLPLAAAFPIPPEPIFRVATRAEAMQLLDETSRYFQIAEPSSPIPWLIASAKKLAEKDFLSLLGELLKERALSDRNAE
ncbi:MULTISPECIES: ImpA family type VI secretion system protein [unclassified Methylosinus]|uniref:type VI secretion system protein TssA n=1 Tax=unclassified Methylosinus TaxID=2624500 RepID=UPI0007C94390|nr:MULTISPECIES: type VI secretion system ImpA family N-terminal domain-containing protein [unclassified Methylosinus]